MATKRQKRKQRRRRQLPDGVSTPDGTSGQAPPAVALDDAQRARAARRRVDGQGPPPSPWGSFPLSEIVIFVGILMLIAGFFVPPPRGFYLMAVGLVLGSLAGLELAIREHFSGYRSHSLLLGGAIGVPVLGGLLIWDPIPPLASVAIGIIVLAASAWLFARAFRSRSGGALYRFKGG